jgi:hypothetical protein
MTAMRWVGVALLTVALCGCPKRTETTTSGSAQPGSEQAAAAPAGPSDDRVEYDAASGEPTAVEPVPDAWSAAIGTHLQEGRTLAASTLAMRVLRDESRPKVERAGAGFVVSRIWSAHAEDALRLRAGLRVLLPLLDSMPYDQPVLDDLRVFDVRRETQQALGWLEVVFTPGFGLSKEQAIPVTAVSDEYVLIRSLPCASGPVEVDSQSLSPPDEDGRQFDTIAVTCGKTQQTLYFDVTEWLGVMNGAMQGTELPAGYTADLARELIAGEWSR